MLETIERSTAGDGEEAAGSIIWLHGLGADGHDFEPLVDELDLPVPVRFVFPHAPIRAVTVNDGLEMRAWYDIDPRSPLAGGEEIRASAAAVAELVAREQAAGIDSRRIVLAGFSQGGVVALHLALRFEEPLAGIMALSTYLHDPEHLADELSFANIEARIFMAHGLMDPMIPASRGAASREALIALGYDLEWHEYAMGHAVCHEEIRDIGHWLASLFQVERAD